jgi:hypothetical protein
MSPLIFRALVPSLWDKKFISVVFPDPEGPIIAVIVPGSNFPDIVVKIDFG